MSDDFAKQIQVASPVITQDEIAAATKVMESGMVVQGPEVAAFETEFGAVSGTTHNVAVNSGTSALHISLLALDIGPGDEVIVPSFSFAASANAVRLTGADVIFADIDPRTFCLDPASVEAAVSTRTVAIMPVHLYGHPADMTAIGRIADKYSLAIVEDACQAHGASLNNQSVGSFGQAGCFSFYPTKNMHTLEGGMVTTNDEQYARKLRLLRNQGMEQRYANEIVGLNVRMTDVSAAIGRVQLKKLPGWIDQRRANAAILDAGLTNTTNVDLTVPFVAEGVKHAYHQYTIRLDAANRDKAQAHLKEQGIASAVYYPTPIHELLPFQGTVQEGDLPETFTASQEVLSLPIHPGLSSEDFDRIIAAVNSL